MNDLSKTVIVKELIESFKSIRKNSFLLVVAALLDALFFIAYGFFTGPVTDKILEHSILVGNTISKLMAEGKTGVLLLLFRPEHRALSGKLLLLILLLFGITYVLYCIFHGTSWYLARSIAGLKTSYREYMLGFAKINLIWIFCCIIYKLLDVTLTLRYQLIQKFAPGSPNIAGTALLLMLVVIVFAALLSYPFLNMKTLFQTPFITTLPLIILTGAVNALPVFVGALQKATYIGVLVEFLVNGSIIGTLQFFLSQVGKFNVDAALMLGLITLFPLTIILKIYLVRVIRHVHARH